MFAPDGNSTSTIMTDLAAELKAQGNDVAVVTTTPHNNVDEATLRQAGLRRRFGGLVYTSERDGIPVWHVKVRRKGTRVRSRIVDFARFHALGTLLAALLPYRYEVILTPTPPLTMGLSALLVGLVRRVPYVFNVQEIFPDVAIRLGVIKSRPAAAVFFLLERLIYRRAARVTTISPFLGERLARKGVPSDRLAVIPNFEDPEVVRPSEGDPAFLAEHGLAGKFVVLYAGNLGTAQNLDTVLDAAAQLRDLPDVVFLLVGEGVQRKRLETEIGEGRHPNVRLVPYVPRGRIGDAYAASSVCLVLLRAGIMKDAFPSKVFSIMASAKPVLAVSDVESDLWKLLRAADCGEGVPPDDAAALAAAVRSAHADPDGLARRGENGRAYLEQHHTPRIVGVMYDALVRRVVDEAAGRAAPLPGGEARQAG